jgi:hypothetical protein
MASISHNRDKRAVVDALQLIIKTKPHRITAASARRLRFRLDTTQEPQRSSMLIAVQCHVLQATTRHSLYVRVAVHVLHSTFRIKLDRLSAVSAWRLQSRLDIIAPRRPPPTAQMLHALLGITLTKAG